MIDLKDITFAYTDKTILNNINLHINDGQFVGLIGLNGAGKSTLLKIILGINKPQAGKVTDTFKKKSFVSQLTGNSDFIFPATVTEVVSLGLKFKPFSFITKEDKHKIKDMLTTMGIDKYANSSISELSGGQQQRVLIARALCATESLLILDEPVTGLDPAVTRELYEILEKLNKKEHTAIVMVTHDIAGALPYADKVLHIGPQGYFFGTRREYCASEEGKRMLGTAFREEEEK